jgi:PAS domain S-box-containing protein
MNSGGQTDNQNRITVSTERIRLIDNIYYLLWDSETSRKGYLITGEKQYANAINFNAKHIDSLLKQLIALSSDNQIQLDNANSLKNLANQKIKLYRESIEVQDSKGTNPKLHLGFVEKGKMVQSDLKDLAEKTRAEEERILAESKNLAEKSHTFTYYIILSGILISSIIFIAVFLVLRKKASKTFDYENQEITREELEQIVKERTAEISQINHKLYQKIDLLEKTEQALKESEQYYKMLFDQAHDAIIIFSPDDERVLDVNQRACDIYGFKKGEFIGLSLKVISKNVPEGEENVKSTLQRKSYHNFQIVHYRKDYTEMLIEVNASVINYKGQNAILSINRDITDRVLKVI